MNNQHNELWNSEHTALEFNDISESERKGMHQFDLMIALHNAHQSTVEIIERFTKDAINHD